MRYYLVFLVFEDWTRVKRVNTALAHETIFSLNSDDEYQIDESRPIQEDQTNFTAANPTM